jgi:hypothetical protein
MTEEQKIKIRKTLYNLDGIEEAEEMIEALEYIEKNPIDEKTLTSDKWFENKFHKADLDRRNFLDQLIKRTDEVTKLYISLFISLITSIALGIYIIYNIK